MDKHCNLPRSKTGLVPSTVRRKMDELSSSLSPLPHQPSPELYQFRGDFLNARNRKRAAAKKQERRAKMEAAAAAAGETECGSSMIVHPPQTPRQLPTHAPDGWNTTYKHNEEYSLTPEERKKQIENKSRFSEFLRIEAAKRHSRSSTKAGITNAPPGKSTPQDTRRQKTKPPVPRLSALALGKKVMGKENMVNIVNPASVDNRRSIDMSKKPKEKVNAALARNKERRKDYLSFISKEPKQMPERETATNVDAPKDKESKVESNADSKPAIADDDSIFRFQMERIVQRAADLVIEKQQKTNVATNDDVPTPSQSLDFDKVVKVKQQDDTQQLPSKDTLRVGNAKSCDATNLLPSNTSSPQSDANEDLSLSVSVDTEVLPRVPVPMQTIAHTRRDLSRSRWTNLYDQNEFSSGGDSSSSSSSGSGLFYSNTDTNVHSCGDTSTTTTTTTIYHRAVNEVAMAELLDVCQDTTSVIQQTVDEPTRKEHPPRQPRDCGEFFEVSASIEDDFFSLFE